jgi:hypothetical protein
LRRRDFLRALGALGASAALPPLPEALAPARLFSFDTVWTSPGHGFVVGDMVLMHIGGVIGPPKVYRVESVERHSFTISAD